MSDESYEFDLPPTGGGNYPVLASGDYDGVVHGLIYLGTQKRTPWEGKARLPVQQFKVIFELPESLREDETKLPNVISKTVNISSHIEKGGLAVFLRALGENPTAETINSYRAKDRLLSLLGKSAVLGVEQFEGSEGRKAVMVKSLTKLDPRLPKPKGTREAFYFNPKNPDIKVFKDVITYFTKKKIMEALDADQFPKEIHQAWAEAQEAEASKQTGQAREDKPRDQAYTTEGIE